MIFYPNVYFHCKTLLHYSSNLFENAAHGFQHLKVKFLVIRPPREVRKPKILKGVGCGPVIRTRNAILRSCHWTYSVLIGFIVLDCLNEHRQYIRITAIWKHFLKTPPKPLEAQNFIYNALLISHYSGKVRNFE